MHIILYIMCIYIYVYVLLVPTPSQAETQLAPQTTLNTITGRRKRTTESGRRCTRQSSCSTVTGSRFRFSTGSEIWQNRGDLESLCDPARSLTTSSTFESKMSSKSEDKPQSVYGSVAGAGFSKFVSTRWINASVVQHCNTVEK